VQTPPPCALLLLGLYLARYKQHPSSGGLRTRGVLVQGLTCHINLRFEGNILRQSPGYHGFRGSLSFEHRLSQSECHATQEGGQEGR
jgi:hypothetical protein